jgi:hypothetical protein
MSIGGERLTEPRMSLTPVSSGLIYRAMGACNPPPLMMVLTSRYIGFPLDFFPVLFAVPRVVGWLAHWRQVRPRARERRAPVISVRSTDDDSRRRREDLETKTGTRIRVREEPMLPLMCFPGGIKVYVGPKKRDYEPIDSRGAGQTRQEPWQQLLNILGEPLIL